MAVRGLQALPSQSQQFPLNHTTPCAALSRSLPMKKFQRSHHLFLLFSHLFILASLSLVSCRCPAHQKSALLNLFSNRSSLPSWKADGSDCCEWEGIRCDHASRHVIELDVGNRHISGSINSSALASLSSLWSFNVAYNDLGGKIPSCLFALPSLKGLFLNQNQLEGELHEFGNASSTLEVIYLSNNKLQGQIPGSIFELRSLQELDLSSNRFNGSFNLSMFQSISNLSHLDLSHNDLVVNPAVEDSSFPQLGQLLLSSCNLKQFPDFLRSQLNMMLLDLSSNKIEGEIPNWLWDVGGGFLRHLNLSENLLTSLQQPYSLSSNNILEVLDLHSNQLQGEIPLPPSSIVHLDYSKNSFASTISSEFLSTLGSANFFSISGNHVSGEIPPSICNASSLQVLDLSDNSFSGSIPNCLRNLNVLSVLNLQNNHLAGMGVWIIKVDKLGLPSLRL